MPVLLEYLDDIRKARALGDGKAQVVACARSQECDDRFVKAVVAAATTLSGCTIAYANRKFEARPPTAQVSLDPDRVVRDVNTRWGIFQTTVLEWECLYKPLPVLRLPPIASGLADKLSMTAPWVATVAEEIANPILRMAQVWRRAIELGLPSELAGGITEVWAYSKRLVLDALTAPARSRTHQVSKILESTDLANVKSEIPEVRVYVRRIDRVWDAQAEHD